MSAAMNEGARAGIEFLHSLPEPLQFAAFMMVLIGTVVLLGACFWDYFDE